MATYYIAEIVSAIKTAVKPPDVIVFNSQSTLNGEEPFVVRTGIEFENEQCRKEQGHWVDIHRKPWHWCVWSSKLAKSAKFPDGYIDDDWYWLRQMLPHVHEQLRIDRILHYYHYNSETSLSNQGKPTT